MCLLITAAMLAMCIPMCVIAADSVTVTLTADKNYVSVGDTVTFTVSLSGCESANSMGFIPQFDSSSFVFVEGSWLLTGANTSDFSEASGIGYMAVIIYETARSFEGDVLTFTLRANEDAVLAESTVTVTASIMNGGTAVGTSVVPSTVTIADKVPQDKLSVCDKAFVLLNGTSVWLILNSVEKLENGTYTYGGEEMMWSDKYGAYCILVVGNKPALLETVDIDTGLSTKSVDYSGDVNATDIIDINDAQLVYNIYNTSTEYSGFTDSVTMEKYLRADLDGSKTVTVEDATAVIDKVIVLQ